MSNVLGTATLTDCTVSGNSAGSGGGLENYAYGIKPGGAITLTGCTHQRQLRRLQTAAACTTSRGRPR